MKKMDSPLLRKTLCLLLTLALLALAAPLAFADEGDSAPVEGGIEITPDYAEEIVDLKTTRAEALEAYKGMKEVH